MSTVVHVPAPPVQIPPKAVAEAKKVVYEQPLNERIRTFIRLEFLFHQAARSARGESEWDSRATLTNLLEILNIFSRSDLKTEVMKELERHCSNLQRLGRNPGVDKRRLEGLLRQMEGMIERLHSTNGQIGVELKKNEFVNSIQQRSTIPGGTCDFDLPAYHFWLQQPSTERIQLLSAWCNVFDPIRLSIDLILRLTRHSAEPAWERARSGFFQKTLDMNLPCQLVRVTLPADAPYFAEISGGKHRCTIRFLEQPNLALRPNQTKSDVNFQFSCCII